MALCVFRRRSSYFSPLAFKVDLPCYESCWEAETASQCLEQLQNLPGSLRLSTAMQTLQTNSLGGAELFDASAFGMTLLILGVYIGRKLILSLINNIARLAQLCLSRNTSWSRAIRAICTAARNGRPRFGIAPSAGLCRQLDCCAGRRFGRCTGFRHAQKHQSHSGYVADKLGSARLPGIQAGEAHAVH